MKKGKIIILIAVFILGVSLVSYGLYSYQNMVNKEKKYDTQKENEPSTQEVSEEDLKYTPITHYSSSKNSLRELCISSFLIKKEEDDIIVLQIELINRLNDVVKDKILKINFYQEDNLVNTFEYKLDELEVEDTVSVETGIQIENHTITKYEFEIESFKTTVVPEEMSG